MSGTLWAKAPTDLITDPAMTLAAMRVYLWLDFRAGRRGYWYGKQSEILEALPVGARSITTAIALLRERKYITTDRTLRARGEITYSIVARSATERGSKSRSDPQFSTSDPQFPALASATDCGSESVTPLIALDPALDPLTIDPARKGIHLPEQDFQEDPSGPYGRMYVRR